MTVKAAKLVTSPEAYALWQDVQLALADVEAVGVRVDKSYLETAVAEVTTRIKGYEESIRADPVYRTWRRRFGDATNTASPAQLAAVVFGDLGYKARHKTKSGSRDGADEAAFAGVDLAIVRHYFAAQKLRKARDTYLLGILRETVRHDDGNWYVHPSYNLNTVATFRSSSDRPNWQNQPNRNPLVAEMIRRAYIPRPGRQIMEFDYGQLEVRVPCFYHSDPVLMDYVSDPDKDMHRDIGGDIFKLPPAVVGKSKAVRHVAKNRFVFPCIYGSYYAQCAPSIWEAVDERTPDGGYVMTVNGMEDDGKPLPVRTHLNRVGLRELGSCDGDPRPGTFEHHLKQIEEDFWGRRFRVFAQWKKDWYAAYLRDGGFRMLSGFAVRTHISKEEGVLNRKQVCNYPIQGVGFHCLAWSLVRVVRRLRKYGFRSRVIGQIHDCLVLDVVPAERDAVIDLVVSVMSHEIRRHWTWINVPLPVEPEVCPVDRPWFEKSGMAERDGVWGPSNPEKWASAYGPWN